MSEQPYDYFEHAADIGIIGRGASLEQALERAATAMFAIMADPARVEARRSVELEFEETDPELVLVTWLNQLLGQARRLGLVFGGFALRRAGAHWHGTAMGEPWRADLDRGTEVKGATLTALAVRERDGIWEARCVVDV